MPRRPAAQTRPWTACWSSTPRPRTARARRSPAAGWLERDDYEFGRPRISAAPAATGTRSCAPRRPVRTGSGSWTTTRSRSRTRSSALLAAPGPATRAWRRWPAPSCCRRGGRPAAPRPHAPLHAARSRAPSTGPATIPRSASRPTPGCFVRGAGGAGRGPAARRALHLGRRRGVDAEAAPPRGAPAGAREPGAPQGVSWAARSDDRARPLLGPRCSAPSTPRRPGRSTGSRSTASATSSGSSATSGAPAPLTLAGLDRRLRRQGAPVRRPPAAPDPVDRRASRAAGWRGDFSRPDAGGVAGDRAAALAVRILSPPTTRCPTSAGSRSPSTPSPRELAAPRPRGVPRRVGRAAGGRASTATTADGVPGRPRARASTPRSSGSASRIRCSRRALVPRAAARDGPRPTSCTATASSTRVRARTLARAPRTRRGPSGP